VAVARPDLLADPDLGREAMVALQGRVADAARFVDDHAVDPATLALAPATLPSHDPDPERAGRRHARARGPVVVGVDVAFPGDRAVAAAVALDGHAGAAGGHGDATPRESDRTERDDRARAGVVATAHAVTDPGMAYVSGLLAFRELDPVLAALDALPVVPDLLVVDGSGRIHYREAGLATHLGVVLDCPAVGVAKNLLCGRLAGPVDDLAVGERVPVHADAEYETDTDGVVGHAVQTRTFAGDRRVNPVYVSPGHRVATPTVPDLVVATTTGYKLPAPTRAADRLADRVRTAHLG
jgi:deoxyribonuclease V